jgi:hypothetical protein
MVEARVRLRMIAEIKTGVEPRVEHGDAGVPLAGDVKLAFVDEPDRIGPIPHF